MSCVQQHQPIWENSVLSVERGKEAKWTMVEGAREEEARQQGGGGEEGKAGGSREKGCRR